MKQTNLSVFITHKGCPHRCSFCNQSEINSTAPVTPEELDKLLNSQLENLRRSEKRAEIAFFGGSFTAVPREYMTDLLKIANAYVSEYPDVYCGIRCSTRPDCIDGEILEILKRYGMTAIELGAQSMDDEVLRLNERGHSAEDVRAASRMIKAYGFSLGLQMMTGLYGDTAEKSRRTAREIIALKPDTVRIYPTVILENTRLGELYKSGLYKSFTLEDTVELCSELLENFQNNGIKVIRLGLHASESIEKSMLGGVYHPAMRELCEGRIYYKKMLAEMKRIGGNAFEVYADRKNISKICGQHGCNRAMLSDFGYTFKLREEAGTDIRIVPTEGNADVL